MTALNTNTHRAENTHRRECLCESVYSFDLFRYTIRFAFTKLYFFLLKIGWNRKKTKNVKYKIRMYECVCVRATDKMFYSSRAIYHLCLPHFNSFKMFRFAKKKNRKIN